MNIPTSFCSTIPTLHNFFEVLKDHVVTSKLRMPDTAVARSTASNESGSLNHKMLNVTFGFFHGDND